MVRLLLVRVTYSYFTNFQSHNGAIAAEWECDTYTEVMALGKAIYAVGKLLGELHLALLVTQVDYADAGGDEDVGAEATC